MTSLDRFDWQKLLYFVSQVFQGSGIPAREAQIIAEAMIEADLRGVDSHGVVRTSIYLERMEKGMVNPMAEIEVLAESEATATLDGHNNFGAVVGTAALQLAMQKAKSSGAALVGVKGSNHFGTGAYYAQRAIQEDLILLVMSNASQTMPPTGGVRPFLGTNPLAVGVPAGEELPFILDMATSVVARGKIIVAAQKGETIPEGWAIDQQGQPTTNAEEALVGSVLPLGGAKGYGISMFIDILSGVLTGAGFGKYVHNMYENWQDPQNVGHLFIAIDIKRFIPIDFFKERMDQYIKEIKAEPKAAGVEEIYIPGEMEHFQTIKRKQEGIELPAKVVEELRLLGHKYGIELRDAIWQENQKIDTK